MKDSMNLCKHFRDEYNQHLKASYQRIDPEYNSSSSGYFVCIQTMTVNGPDHKPVNLEECHNGRHCFIK